MEKSFSFLVLVIFLPNGSAAKKENENDYEERERLGGVSAGGRARRWRRGGRGGWGCRRVGLGWRSALAGCAGKSIFFERKRALDPKKDHNIVMI